MELLQEIRRRVFRFQRADGTVISLVVQLLPNGRMTSLGHENEASWAIEAGLLVFLGRDGSVTTRFSEVTEADGRLVLRGRLLTADGGGVVHELHGCRAYDRRIRPRESLHARIEVGRGARALVIVLNGRGFTYDGEDTRHTFFEMAGLAPTLDADSVHVAEREERCAWYADKADRVVSLLEGVAGLGGGRVLLAGTSAGGFGAILVAELLGRRRPDLEIGTITLNPQTSLRTDVQEALSEEVAGRWLAPAIAPDALAACRAEWLHLPDLIRARPGAGPVHEVLFDSGNPAEARHASLLERVPRCRLLPRALGVPHMEGPGLLYGSGEVHALARAFMEG